MIRVEEGSKKFLPKILQNRTKFFYDKFQLDLLIVFEFFKKYFLILKYVKFIRENNSVVLLNKKKP